MAVDQGFEPREGVNPRQFSRLLLNTPYSMGYNTTH